MAKNLTKNLDNRNLSAENNFGSIKITLASLIKLNHGLLEKLKSQKP